MKYRIRAAGGLGNQLLQYFGALHVSQVLKQETVFDLSEIDLKHTKGKYDLRSFVEPENNLSICKYPRYHPWRFTLRIVRKLAWLFKKDFMLVTVVENREDIESLQDFIRVTQKKYSLFEITGWFSNFDYFHSLQKIQRQLTLKSPSKEFTQYQDFLSGKDYVAIHLRFGDYMENPSIYGVLTREYYERALEALGVSTQTDLVVFFSNDNSKIDEFLNLSNFNNFLLLDDSPEFDPAEVMVLMSGANKIITSNSTFSYVAALLAMSANVAFPLVNVKGEQFILNTPSNWIEIRPSWL